MLSDHPGKDPFSTESTTAKTGRSIDVVEEYEVSPGVSSVRILLNTEEMENIYYVKEPEFHGMEKMLIDQSISEIEQMLPLLTRGDKTSGFHELSVLVDDYLESRHPENGEDFNSKIRYAIEKRHVGFGKLHVPVLDSMVEDISCNGPGRPVYVYHKNYGSLKTNILYDSEAELSSVLVKLAQLCGKEVSVSSPILDGITSAGHRVQGMYGKEISPRGSAFTIRLFRERPFTPIDLIRSGAASAEMITYMWYMVEYLNSALIVGPPAVGKTSALNSILMMVPPNTKVMSIEETREINILHPNWVAAATRDTSNTSAKITSSDSRIDMFDLVKMAMRQRPTYLVVGEVRGNEAYTLFQAMSTGHTTYSTMHAESMGTMLNRLESEPLNIPRILVSYLKTVIISHFIRRGPETLRRVTEINEITGVDPSSNDVVYNRVFSYDTFQDRHVFSGYSITLRKVAAQRNISERELMDEFRERMRLIDYMVSSEDMDYRQISETFNKYYNNREELENLLAEGTNGSD